MMNGLAIYSGIFLLLALISCTESTVEIFPEDPYSDVIGQPLYEPEPDVYTNLTIDELIASTYGPAGIPTSGIDGQNIVDAEQAYMDQHFMYPDGTLLAELDMRLTLDQFQHLYDYPTINGTGTQKRKATRPVILRWTNKLIPYEFVQGHFSASETYKIKEALQTWMDTTCLKFRPASYSDRNKIRFQGGAGCNSALGMVGGTQVINLQSPGCRYMGLYLHEVGHAIGLVHEHQLPDRDAYINIIYNNVSPSMRVWFNKYSSQEVNQYGVPYEYSSVMHYGVTAFSYDGRSQTIRAKDPSREAEIGQVWAKGLSFSDIKVVNLMYGCNAHCAADSTCKNPGYLDKNCKCQCPLGVDCGSGGGGGGGGGGGSGSCTNSYGDGQCIPWASNGECDKNPDWMRENCKKACGACETTATTTTATTTTTSPPTANPPTTTTSRPTGSCTNEWPDSQCQSWATRGECNANPAFMKVYCKKACRECTETTTTTSATTTTQPPSSTSAPPTGTTIKTTYMPSPRPTTVTTTATPERCVNSYGDSQCNPWAQRGECNANPTWMRSNCAKACGVCGGGSCVDRHHFCVSWAQRGECRSNPNYMLTTCKKSCRVCYGNPGPGCVDSNSNCSSWAQHGYCTTSEHVQSNCRKACNLCG